MSRSCGCFPPWAIWRPAEVLIPGRASRNSPPEASQNRFCKSVKKCIALIAAITNDIETSLELQTYVNRRVACAKRFVPNRPKPELQRKQLLYCAAYDIAKLKLTRKGRLRWIGTKNLAEKIDESFSEVRSYDDLMDEFGGKQIIAFTARVAIKRFIECVRIDGAHRIPCKPDFARVFEWWAGTGLVQGLEGEWSCQWHSTSEDLTFPAPRCTASD
jgi:hypothetical protein